MPSFCLVTRRIILFGSCLHSITITRDEQSSFTTRLVRFDIQPSTFSANPNVKIGLLFNACTCAFFKFLFFFPSLFYFRMPHSISLTNKLFIQIFTRAFVTRNIRIPIFLFSFLFFPFIKLFFHLIKKRVFAIKNLVMIYKVFFYTR